MTIKIPTPATANKFRVFPLGLGNTISQSFAMAVTKTDINFVNNTLSVFVRQSLTNDEMPLVKMVVSNNSPFQIDFMSRSGSPSLSYYTANSDIVDHTLALDYSDHNFLYHKIVIKFKQLVAGEGPYVMGGEPDTGMVSLDPKFPDVTNVDLDALTSKSKALTNEDLRSGDGC